MVEEFNLRKERRKLFETELLGKITSAGRIYRKIIFQDEEFIKRLKEELLVKPMNSEWGTDEIINKLSGKELKQKSGEKK